MNKIIMYKALLLNAAMLTGCYQNDNIRKHNENSFSSIGTDTKSSDENRSIYDVVEPVEKFQLETINNKTILDSSLVALKEKESTDAINENPNQAEEILQKKAIEGRDQEYENNFENFIHKMKNFATNKVLSEALSDLQDLCKKRDSLKKNYWHKYNNDYRDGKSIMCELDIATEDLSYFEEKSVSYAIENLKLYSKKFLKHYNLFEQGIITKERFIETLCEVDSCMMSAIQIVYVLDTRNKDSSYRYIDFDGRSSKKEVISRKNGNILMSNLYKLIETTRDGMNLFNSYKSKQNNNSMALSAIIKNLHNVALPSIKSFKETLGDVPLGIENFSEDETISEIQDKYHIPEESFVLTLLNNNELKYGKIAKLWGLFNFSFLNKRERGLAYFLSSLKNKILSPIEDLVTDLYNLIDNTQSKNVVEGSCIKNYDIKSFLNRDDEIAIGLLTDIEPEIKCKNNKRLKKVEALAINQIVRNRVMEFKHKVKYEDFRETALNCMKILNRILTEETYAGLSGRNGSTKGLLYAGKWIPNNREAQISETEYSDLLKIRDQLSALLVFIESNGSMHISINPNRNSKIEFFESEAEQRTRETIEKGNRSATLLMLQGVFNSIPDVAFPLKTILTVANAGLNFINNHNSTSNLINRSNLVTKNLF